MDFSICLVTIEICMQFISLKGYTEKDSGVETGQKSSFGHNIESGRVPTFPRMLHLVVMMFWASATFSGDKDKAKVPLETMTPSEASRIGSRFNNPVLHSIFARILHDTTWLPERLTVYTQLQATAQF